MGPSLRPRPDGPFRHTRHAERWQRGRMRRTRNAVYGQPYRGFESHPLRQSPPALVSVFRIIPLRRRTGGFAQPIRDSQHRLRRLCAVIRVSFAACSLENSSSVRFPCYSTEQGFSSTYQGAISTGSGCGLGITGNCRSGVAEHFTLLRPS